MSDTTLDADTQGPIQVVVEIEHTEGTISGQLAAAGAAPVRFFGWLELMDRLERATRPVDVNERSWRESDGSAGRW